MIIKLASIMAPLLLMLALNTETNSSVLQSAEPKTVRDYFLLAPEAYIGYSHQFREDLLLNAYPQTVVDLKNGYISYEAADNPEAFEFAIFKKPDGRYLIAYSVGFDPDFPETTSRFVLLNYENGKWSDVTKALLPVPFNKRLTYKLPRQGREIIVKDEKDRIIYTLMWTEGKFIINRRK